MFEHLGYFETIMDKETHACIGTFKVPEASHGLCYENRVEKVFKKGEILQIDKAHKGIQSFRFKRDTPCVLITYPLCGRLLHPICLNEQK